MGKKGQFRTIEMVNNDIYETTINNIQKYIGSSNELLRERLVQLKNERSIEKVFLIISSIILFFSCVLGLSVETNYFFMSLLVSLIILLYTLLNWCPFLTLLRHLNCRYQKEINDEKLVIKYMLGEFVVNEEVNPLEFYKLIKKINHK